MNNEKKIYPQLIKDIEDWPIYRLHKDRSQFVQEIIDFTFHRLRDKHRNNISDLIAKTIYLERIRIKEEPWKVDPPNERQFWSKIKKKLISKSLDRSEEEAQKNNEELVQMIISRYAEEIVSTFRIKTFLFARKFLTLFFTRLLNTAAGKFPFSFWGSKLRLSDRFKVEGPIEDIRSLMKKGTVVIVPTHFSNLDSILVGYAMDAFAGLPSFTYGAGLNLFNTGYVAYFMNRIGTYRVDRRKKNPIYLETLKGMSNLSLQKGTNTLFFPGGTRSRSGMIEKKLKLGLMGTVVEAQRAMCQRGEDNKIFIVPIILSYHFVLEAQLLIEQHLRRIGKERYIKSKDDSLSIRKIIRFAWQLFSQSNEIMVSIGQPMDVLGNPVDQEGKSVDQFGNPIRIEDYFISNGAIVPDKQREMQYTKVLGDRIIERYYKDNIVMSSHLVAFAAFNVLKQQNKNLDLYGLLRLPTDEYVFPKDLVLKVIKQLQEKLYEMADKEEVKLSKPIRLEPEAVLEDGMKFLGTFHAMKPLRYNKKGEIISENFKILFYYHNRLENYKLDSVIQWKLKEQEVV